MHQMKQMGVLFSLDDFGSGLSSFGYLKNFDVEFIKIDGIFVKDILEDKVDGAMVKAINEVSKVMNKKTVAEYVENDEIRQKLSEISVDYVQGYGVEKPRPLSDVIAETNLKKTS